MKLFEKIYRLNIIIIVILVIVYLQKIYIDKSICGFSFARVVGSSMYPTLKDGNFLIVNENADYEIDDIICYYNEENKRVVHRIVDIDENTYLTKGDHNELCDNPINKNQIIGKVVFKSTVLGILFQNIDVITIGFAIFCFLKLKNLDKYDKMYI